MEAARASVHQWGAGQVRQARHRRRPRRHHPALTSNDGERGAEAAAAYWAEALAGWDVPAQVAAVEPVEPIRFPPALFRWLPGERRDTPSGQRALEALPNRGWLLDVGAGGGRASLSLAPPAAVVAAVDQDPDLLASFSQSARQAGIDHRTVLGRWPDVDDQVGVYDVVVCHHVVYNVADLVPFAAALTAHARHRVVVELTAEHPASNLNPAWRALWGVERPTSPGAADAAAVLAEMGLDVHSQRWERPQPPGAGRDRAEVVAFARRRLRVGPERDAEIDALLPTDAESPTRHVVTLWWPGGAC